MHPWRGGPQEARGRGGGWGRAGIPKTPKLLSTFHPGTQKVETRSSFRHRVDHLQTRAEDSRSGQVQECFEPGRPRALKGGRGTRAECFAKTYC